MGLKISDEAFQYLRIQKGRLEPLAEDRAQWTAAYEVDLLRTFTEILAYLPERCWGLLDIGSGLGGIDILLSRHYAEIARTDIGATRGIPSGPYVNLLDGENDPPEMRLHRETFNDMRVAKDFLTSNGIRADRFAYYTPDSRDFRKPYDLVVSFGSWCFHYEPDTYLPQLLAGGGLHRDSVVIVDLRNGKPNWGQQLFEAGFRPVAVVREVEKYRRIVFDRK